LPREARQSRKLFRSGGAGRKRGVGKMNSRPALAFSPPQFFVFRKAKYAARKEVVFAPPTRAHTTDLLPLFCLPSL